MKNLGLFLSYLCGDFNNDRQIEEQEKTGNVTHPKAIHIIRIINNKIKNLPENFGGFFVLQEGYYTQNEKESTQHHIFLFTENRDEKVVLTSYDIPKSIPQSELKNSNDNLSFDYNELSLSEKFTPMVYDFINSGYEGKSVSHFTKDLTFTLEQRVEENTLYVSEIFEKNGKVTFGFKEPIVFIQV